MKWGSAVGTSYIPTLLGRVRRKPARGRHAGPNHPSDSGQADGGMSDRGQTGSEKAQTKSEGIRLIRVVIL